MRKTYKRKDNIMVNDERKDDNFWLNAWVNNAGSIFAVLLIIAGFIGGYAVLKYQNEQLNKNAEADEIKIEAISHLVDKHEAIIPTIQQDVKDIKRSVNTINDNITKILMEVRK